MADEFMIGLEGILFEDFYDILSIAYNGESTIEKIRLKSLSSAMQLLEIDLSDIVFEEETLDDKDDGLSETSIENDKTNVNDTDTQ